MSNKFIGLDDAADKLGISKDRLNELREAGELRAYRDGTSWKFRTEEIDELAAKGVSSGDDDLSLDSDIGLVPPSDAPINLGDDALSLESEDDVLDIESLDDGEDAESILLTNDEVDADVARPPSTIIGKSELSLEDDLSLSDDLQLESVEGESTGKSSNTSGSFDDLEELEIDLDAESSRLLDASDIAAAQAAASASAESIEGASLEIEEDLELELEGSDALSEGSDVLNSVDEGTDELLAKDGSSGSIMGLSGLDQVELGEDEQDDLVLGDGSDDISLATSDSGINLAPSDSGIALDEVPLDLGGSAIGSALDLASLSASIQESSKPVTDASASGSDVTGGDEFLLTPISGEDSGEEDSSQVVALDGLEDEEAPEGSFAFSDIGSNDAGDGGLGFEAVEDDGLGGDFGGGIDSPAGEPVAASASDEATFPTWIMCMLFFCMFSMGLCGLMAMDLINSMWSWNEPFELTSSIMEQLIALAGD